MALVENIKQSFRTSGDTGAHKYLMVPIFMFFALLIFAPIYREGNPCYIVQARHDVMSFRSNVA